LRGNGRQDRCGAAPEMQKHSGRHAVAVVYA